MISFNYVKIRTDEKGKTFLDLELNLLFAPQKTILRLSIPASTDYQPETGHLTISNEQQAPDIAG